MSIFETSSAYTFFFESLNFNGAIIDLKSGVTITGDGTQTQLRGFDQNDTTGQFYHDTLIGSDANETLYGYGGNDRLIGGSGVRHDVWRNGRRHLVLRVGDGSSSAHERPKHLREFGERERIRFA